MSDNGNMNAEKETRNTPSREADVELGTRAHMLIWSEGRKQGDIATAMGISSGSLGLKLKGQRGWALAEIKALAQILNTTVAYLVGETENPHPNKPSGGRRVGLTGFDPMTSTVETGRLAPITPIFRTAI